MKTRIQNPFPVSFSSFASTLIALGTACVFSSAFARQEPDQAWFGVVPPPGFQAHQSPVILGSDYPPRPARVPPEKTDLLNCGERQWFEQTPGTSLWLPLSWEVRLFGDPAFGADSPDIILESAMPAGGTEIPPEGLTAPLVFVGTARPAELQTMDVRG